MWLSSFLLLSGICVTGLVINMIPYTYGVYDIGHTYLPVLDRVKYGWITECGVFGQIALTLYTVPIKLWPSLFSITGLFYWIRAITLPLTIAPSIKGPHERINMYGLFGGINDLIPFSGHQGILMISLYFLWNTYGVKLLILDLLLGLTIIILRNHYTTEVVMSCIFCPMFCDFYFNRLTNYI